MKFPFPDKKQKTNLPSEYPKEINEFISSVRSDLIGSEKKDIYSNLTKDEWEALESLKQLQKDGKIVIQSADKNGGICIIDREDYIEEANRQLNDKLIDEKGEELNYYQKTNEKTVKDQYKKIENIIDEGVELGYFSKEFGKKLLPEKPKSSNLYLLPKVHKKFERIPKGRPIIAACGSNTERISWLLDNLGKDAVKNLDSFIEDTPDLLRKFEEINEQNQLPPEAKPYSIDIKSFYTNIILKEGLEAFKAVLDELKDTTIPSTYLIKLLRIVMECNIFKLNDEFWIQLIGTSMGTRVAPTYASLFMGKLEKEILQNCLQHLKQFIDTWTRFSQLL